MTRFRYCLAAALVALAPVAARADPTAIVISGSTDHALHRRLWNFVTQVIQNDGAEQLGRRHISYCPQVTGIAAQYEPVVLARIREAAQATGALTESKPGCRPNLVILFSVDADATMRDMLRHDPALLADTSPPDTSALLRGGQAVRWWYAMNTTSIDGDGIIDGMMLHGHGSRLSSGIKLYFATSYVLVDLKRAEGYPLDTVASYAAMVSFAQISGERRNLANAPSVLGVFDRTGPRLQAQRDLTAWDRAYLYAMYHIYLDRPIRTQRDNLAYAMQKIMVSQGAATPVR